MTQKRVLEYTQEVRGQYLRSQKKQRQRFLTSLWQRLILSLGSRPTLCLDVADIRFWQFNNAGRVI